MRNPLLCDCAVSWTDDYFCPPKSSVQLVAPTHLLFFMENYFYLPKK
uniref:Uncharacterized protein n=1 Tax=Myoviridae sp. ctNYa18 TaxID=2825090 RepID=A0A8S5PHU1_9CAUD|nr:MAG TPA: hypothetical protein [Myoviridae sp. ctNYa18]